MTAFLLLLFVVSVSKDLKVPVSTVIERELQKLLGNKDLKQFNSDFLERHSRSLLHRLSGNDHMFVGHFLLFSDLSSCETRGFHQQFMTYVTQTWSGLIHWYNWGCNRTPNHPWTAIFLQMLQISIFEQPIHPSLACFLSYSTWRTMSNKPTRTYLLLVSCTVLCVRPKQNKQITWSPQLS